MKSLFAFCILCLVAYATAKPGSFPEVEITTKLYDFNALHPRGCIWIEGKCFDNCPIGTHDYAPGCDQEVFSKPTCAEPEVRSLGSHICDYTACICDKPKVWDEDNKKCVLLQDCPKSPTKDN